MLVFKNVPLLPPLLPYSVGLLSETSMIAFAMLLIASRVWPLALLARMENM